jgi:hypothetical protein
MEEENYKNTLLRERVFNNGKSFIENKCIMHPFARKGDGNAKNLLQ